MQSSIGRAAPAANGAVLLNIGEDWLSDRGVVLGITDCAGVWAKVRYSLPRPPARGPRTGEAWFAGICGEQRTTCDLDDRRNGR
ncbi:hypothetical protein [Sphingomonas sp.]|uniref:hypothetical protein n=1 Tax=Sphingomonas sp. TaxID=28214 RepID=UPI003AFFB9DA